MSGPFERRRLLGAVAALLELWTARPVAASASRRPNPPKQNPGNRQPGNGKIGAPGSSSACQAECDEQFEGCAEPCGGNGLCLGICRDRRDRCLAQCRAD